MPFVYSQVAALEDEKKAGNGDCVDLIKKYVPGLKNVSATQCWRQGANVMENRHRLVRGTAIATFVNGRYPSVDVSKHAAIFLGSAGNGGFYVMDQWLKAKAIKSRIIHIARPRVRPDSAGQWPAASNVAQAFYVIELSACPKG